MPNFKYLAFTFSTWGKISYGELYLKVEVFQSLVLPLGLKFPRNYGQNSRSRPFSGIIFRYRFFPDFLIKEMEMWQINDLW
jgi:hypothetical protein